MLGDEINMVKDRKSMQETNLAYVKT